MKAKQSSRFRIQAVACLGAFCIATAAYGQITVPGADGSDGALQVPESTVIDLSLAVDGAWDDPGTGTGVYDKDQWAVVFKYSSVQVLADAVVTFAPHPSGAPVIWLVSGNVTLDGTVSLDGGNSPESTNKVAPGGPGGFPGGLEPAGALAHGSGFGPGGSFGIRAGASFSTVADTPAAGTTGRTYGNSQIIPLIGGSGGGGEDSIFYGTNNGGGGGGALLVAATGTITVNGLISADGGDGGEEDGSGGAIRLVCDTLTGTGNLSATSQFGSAGRIRLEALVNDSIGLTIVPETILVPPASPVKLWPDTTYPTAAITAVGGVSIGDDPEYLRAFDTTAPDALLNTTDPVTVEIATTNIAFDETVELVLRPLRGEPSFLPASFVSGDESAATWNVTGVTLPQGNFVLQVIAEKN